MAAVLCARLSVARVSVLSQVSYRYLNLIARSPSFLLLLTPAHTATSHKAVIATHSTAYDAGRFATQIEAKQLVLTHFSARFESALLPQTPRWTRDSAPGVPGMGTALLNEARAGAVRGARRPAQDAGGAQQGPIPIITLARDFMTVPVPPREPVRKPDFDAALEKLRHEMAAPAWDEERWTEIRMAQSSRWQAYGAWATQAEKQAENGAGAKDPGRRSPRRGRRAGGSPRFRS